jgi:hypothetical protein
MDSKKCDGKSIFEKYPHNIIKIAELIYNQKNTYNHLFGLLFKFQNNYISKDEFFDKIDMNLLADTPEEEDLAPNDYGKKWWEMCINAKTHYRCYDTYGIRCEKCEAEIYINAALYQHLKNS